VSAEQYEQQYDQLLASTIKALPHVRLVLCEPFGLPVGAKKANWESYKAELSKRQAVVSRLAKKYNAALVLLQQVFDDATRRAEPDYWIWDGVHPTYSGQQLVANAWVKEVRAFWPDGSH
jgi:lysophospholipase L1-like esterase